MTGLLGLFAEKLGPALQSRPARGRKHPPGSGQKIWSAYV